MRPCDDGEPLPGYWRPCQHPERPLNSRTHAAISSCARCRVAVTADAAERPHATTLVAEPLASMMGVPEFTVVNRVVALLVAAEHTPDGPIIRRALASVT